MRTVSHYDWHTGKLASPVQLAVVSDLHDEDHQDLWPFLEGVDCLLVPGDVADRYRQCYRRGLAFLNEAAERMPTFFSMGNHEMRLHDREKMLDAFAKSKATILFNRYVAVGSLWIGGWYRPQEYGVPDMTRDFEREQGCKILMCHRPEDYMKRLRGLDVDLVLAGHAHGGQVRIGDQGMYAPGQGFFPQYTKGIVDGRMIVSAGAGNPVKMPRWRNPCEIVRITLD